MTTPAPPPPAPFTLAAPVPSLLWDTFEEALRLNVRRLAKDIATTLGQPDAPLLQALLKAPAGTVRPYLFEEDGAAAEKEVDMRCDYLCQRPEAPRFLQPCRQPVVWVGAESCCRCSEHLYSRQVKPGTLPVLEALESCESDAALYVGPDEVVYTAEYEPCGRYERETKRLILFQAAAAPDDTA